MTARCIFANLNFYFAFVVQRKTKSRHRFLLEIDESGQMNASIDSFQCISANEIFKMAVKLITLVIYLHRLNICTMSLVGYTIFQLLPHLQTWINLFRFREICYFFYILLLADRIFSRSFNSICYVDVEQYLHSCVGTIFFWKINSC